MSSRPFSSELEMGNEDLRAASKRRISRERIILVAILSLGLALRLFHWVIISDTPLRETHLVPGSDNQLFWDWAQQIVSGDLLGAYQSYNVTRRAAAPVETWYYWEGGKEVFRTAPLYPYWLAALLAISGRSALFVFLMQLLVGAFHPLIMFGLGRRLFDESVGLLASFLTALYGPFIFYEGVILRDWLPPIVFQLALLGILKASDSGFRRDWLLAGVGLGLGLLAKETLLLFMALVGIWLVCKWRHEWRAAAWASLFLLGGLLLSLSPLIIRNFAVGVSPFALSNRAAETFVDGNAADAAVVGWKGIPNTMKSIMERSDGRLFPTIRETLKTYDGHYGEFIRKQLLKLWAVADPRELAGGIVGFDYGVEISPVLRYTFTYGMIFPLGISGLIFSLPAWRRQQLLLLFLVAMVGGLLYGIVQERYRLTLVPVLILYGAFFLVWLFRAFTGKHAAQAVAGLALVAGVAGAQEFGPLPDRYTAHIQTEVHLLASRFYASQGKYDLAVAELERHRRTPKPYSVSAESLIVASMLEGNYRLQWAKQLLGEGRREEAERQLELAEAAYGDHLPASSVYYNLGQFHLFLRHEEKAKVFFQKFLALEPDGNRADEVRTLLSMIENHEIETIQKNAKF